MADGFDIHLNEDQARRLKAAAEASGLDAQAFALQVLDQAIKDDLEEARRWGAYLRTGETVPLEDALIAFDAELKRKLAERR